MLAPASTNNRFDLHSSYMDNNDLYGMDIHMYNRKRESFPHVIGGWSQERLLDHCEESAVGNAIYEFEKGDQNITDEQLKSLIEMMTFLLTHAKMCVNQKTADVGRTACVNLLGMLTVLVLNGNKKMEGESWIKEHLSELVAIRSTYGNSLLHGAAHCTCDRTPRAPFVKLLVERGKMDVNVENISRQTPFHLLCRDLAFMKHYKMKLTQDMMTVAELLIYNGAHMDSQDDMGREASAEFSKTFTQWSFNVNLKCLAAKAIVKDGVSYENIKPATLIPFIETHKRGEN